MSGLRAHLPPDEPPPAEPDPKAPPGHPPDDEDDSPVPPDAETPSVDLPGREPPGPRIRAQVSGVVSTGRLFPSRSIAT